MKEKSKGSQYEELRLRSIDYMQAAQVLLENNLNQNAIEQLDMAVEMIMKSAIVKAGGSPPRSGTKGHDFRVLSEIPVSGKPFDGQKKLLTAINSTHFIRESWHTIYNNWSPSDRYRQLELDNLDVMDLSKEYRKVWAWIKNNFVE